MPRCRAATAAWVRSATLRRARIVLTCHFTVPTVMLSVSAISLLLMPFTLSKNFSVREQLRFKILFEAFNAFNHSQFSGVDSTARFHVNGNQITRDLRRLRRPELREWAKCLCA